MQTVDVAVAVTKDQTTVVLDLETILAVGLSYFFYSAEMDSVTTAIVTTAVSGSSFFSYSVATVLETAAVVADVTETVTEDVTEVVTVASTTDAANHPSRRDSHLLVGEQKISPSGESQSPTEMKPPADCRGALMYFISKADGRLAARMPVAFLNLSKSFRNCGSFLHI